ncbi:hypothetical protein BGZ73_005037 [Actinomortierella ambigua]|nr:hypothetical protein BGZ73_005037 [Actinomortierella ambigua]
MALAKISKGSLVPEGPWPKAAIAVITLQTIIAIILEALVLRQHRQNTPSVIYPSLYIFAFVSLYFIYLDAIRDRNQIQIVVGTIFSFVCMAYGIVQYMTDMKEGQASTRLNVLNMAVFITVGVGSLALTGLAWQLAKTFGWQLYRTLGADIRVRRMRKFYEVLITLLKLDIFFFLAFAVQMFFLVDTTDKTVWLTIGGTPLARSQVLIGLAIPGAIVLLGLAFYGIMRESKYVTLFVMVCFIAAEPYFVYQAIYLHQPQNRDRYRLSLKYLTFFIVVTMLLVLATLLLMAYCFRDFGKGLLISGSRRKQARVRTPFAIDDETTELQADNNNASTPSGQDGSSGGGTGLMAYTALQKVQKDYNIVPQKSYPQQPPFMPHHLQQHQGAQQSVPANHLDLLSARISTQSQRSSLPAPNNDSTTELNSNSSHHLLGPKMEID